LGMAIGFVIGAFATSRGFGWLEKVEDAEKMDNAKN